MVKTFFVFFIAISGVLRNKVGARSVESRLSDNSMIIQCVTGDEFDMRVIVGVQVQDWPDRARPSIEL